MPSDYEIHEATPSDANSLATVFHSAFSDTFNKTMFPPTPEVHTWVATNFLNGNALGSEHEVILKISDGNTPIAFAKWVRPFHADSDRDLSVKEMQWPLASDKELCERFFGTMSEHHERIMGFRPHYYLEMLAVHQEWQGRGLASMLLRWGLARADEEDVEVYLSSSPDGKGLYQKYGFEMLDSFSPFEGYEQLNMIRPAQHHD